MFKRGTGLIYRLPVRVHTFSASQHPVLGRCFYLSGDSAITLQALDDQLQLVEQDEI